MNNFIDTKEMFKECSSHNCNDGCTLDNCDFMKKSFNISHWDTSGVKDISKDPVIMEYVKTMRELLSFEPIFDSKKEKFLYYSKKVARFIAHLTLTLIFTIFTLAFINFIIHYFN